LFTEAHCGWHYFLQQNFNKASDLWREILQGPKYNVETRTQATTRLYLIILYYTQQDTILLESELINTKRFLKQHFLLEKNEKLFIDAFAKLNYSIADKAVFENLSNHIKKSDSIITEKSVLNRFIIQWISDQN
jgi:hypothetical protein